MMSEVAGKLDIRQFSEQLGKAVQTLGAKDAMGCMARALAFIAQSAGTDLEFTCSQGVVTVKRTGATPVKH